MNNIFKEIDSFTQKFDNEEFKKVEGIDGLIFEDSIYVSNYGEVYNKTQKKLHEYENSTVYIKISHEGIKGISRWKLTTSTFDIIDSEYEKNRKLKKIKYGFSVQNSRKYLKDQVNLNNDCEIIKKKEERNNGNDEFNIEDLNIELIKYKFFYEEVIKQKNNLEKKITGIEELIKHSRETNENKYKNTLIYMIRPKHNNFYMYVGHTIDKNRRLKEHRRATETENSKLYKTIRETGGWDHWEMVEISTSECKCREEALKIEQDWCEKLRPNLNSVSPFA